MILGAIIFFIGCIIGGFLWCFYFQKVLRTLLNILERMDEISTTREFKIIATVLRKEFYL